jgi:hypothetical protein
MVSRPEDRLSSHGGWDSGLWGRSPLPNHDGVHNPHTHPANLGEDQWQGKAQCRPELLAEGPRGNGMNTETHS